MKEIIYKEGVPLGRHILAGQKIKTAKGWRKILGVTVAGANIKDKGRVNVINYGDLIYGVRM